MKRTAFLLVLFFVFCATAVQAAPTRVIDLTAIAVSPTAVQVNWTVPTPTSGHTLTENDIRRSLTSISALNWATRTQVAGEPLQGIPGTTQTMNISGLNPGTTYYFGIRVKDTSGTWSLLSNLAITTTLTQTLVTLSWVAPTTKVDGTPLTNLAGYKIYYGLASGAYTNVIDVGNTTNYQIKGLDSGTYYFAVTAYDTDGNESGYSNEVSKAVLP